MATIQISLITIFLLFLSLVFLLLPASNGATYRIHDLNLRNKEKDNKMINFQKASFSLLTKGVPISPSGPSRRHNGEPDGDGSDVSSSAKDGPRV
ncbi:hypothetical protein DITRI_Ditri06bG0113300 [Diplodiscus trichospermus]